MRRRELRGCRECCFISLTACAEASVSGRADGKAFAGALREDDGAVLELAGTPRSACNRSSCRPAAPAGAGDRRAPHVQTEVVVRAELSQVDIYCFDSRVSLPTLDVTMENMYAAGEVTGGLRCSGTKKPT